MPLVSAKLVSNVRAPAILHFFRDGVFETLEGFFGLNTSGARLMAMQATKLQSVSRESTK
jgi:hypothetical protein